MPLDTILNLLRKQPATVGAYDILCPDCRYHVDVERGQLRAIDGEGDALLNTRSGLYWHEAWRGKQANLSLSRRVAAGMVEIGLTGEYDRWQWGLVALKKLQWLAGARYVEGWVMPRPGWETEAGWLELDGEVIDLHMTVMASCGSYWRPLFFAGPSWALKEAEALRLQPGPTQKKGELPLVWRWGWSGSDHLAYMAALLALRLYRVGTWGTGDDMAEQQLAIVQNLRARAGLPTQRGGER